MSDEKRPCRIDSIILVVEDVAAARVFYHQAMDLEAVSTIRDRDRITDVELRNGDFKVVISRADSDHRTASPRAAGASSVTVTLAVVDCDASTERFVRAGGRLRSGPKDRPWGVRAALVEDPFGHRWMLQAPLPPQQVADE